MGVALLAACSGPSVKPEATVAPAPTAAAAEEPAPPPAPPPLPPPPEGWLVTLTVVSAEVAGRMPNGENWDDKKLPATSGVPQPIARYLEQHPELFGTEAFVGVPIDAPKLEEESANTPAADPMVIVEIGDRVFRTTVKPRQFNPVWDFPITFLVGKHGDRHGVAMDANVQLHVVDYDGPSAYDTIGSTLLAVSDLGKQKVHVIGPIGNVTKLTLRVDERPLPSEAAPPPHKIRLAVPGKELWTATGVELIAGQRVTIEAADEVCSKGGSLTHCSGPEGQRTTSSYNQPGFEKVGHGALVAAVGDTRFPVKRQLSFVAPSSGTLLLGINDKDTKDNRGSYAVRIEVAALP